MDAFEVEGYPIHIEESPNIKFKAEVRDIRSLAAVERAQAKENKKKEPTPGRRFVAVAKLRPGAKWPTRAEWLERRRRKSGEIIPSADGELFSDNTDSKIAARRMAAEERAAAKIAERNRPVE